MTEPLPDYYTDFLDKLMIKRRKIILYFKDQFKVDFEESEQAFTDCLIKLLEKRKEGKFIVTTNHQDFFQSTNYFYGMMSNHFKMQLRSKKVDKLEVATAIFYEDYYTGLDTEELLIRKAVNRTIYDNALVFLSTKYSTKQVNIFKNKLTTKETQKQIAKKYGKSESTISLLLKKMHDDLKTEFKQTLTDLYNLE